MDHKKLIFLAILLAGVTACSDNDSDEPETPVIPEAPGTPDTPTTPATYSITAIDGYLRHAEVWLDVNGNFILDADEPMTTSGEGGKAVLDTTGIATPEQYPVVVQVKAGITIDEDSIDADHAEGIAVEHDYVMSAPAGEKNITPLSTHTHIRMSYGETKEVAINNVATSLGLEPAGLLEDFIAPETKNEANAFAASNIVDSKSLPADAETLQVIATEPTSSEAQEFAKTTAAVNETIQETVDETNESGGDFSQVEDIYDPAEDTELDTDGDGVPDHIDAFPYDKDFYLPSEALAYTSYYRGTQVKSSDDNQGTVKVNEDKRFTGTTAGKAIWFYTPTPKDIDVPVPVPVDAEGVDVDMGFLLSGLSDFQFKVSQFTGGAYTNIYVKPTHKDAYLRIVEVAAPKTDMGAPLRDTDFNKKEYDILDRDAHNDTYVLTIKEGETLNSVMQGLRKSAPEGAAPVSKADFIVLDYVDAPNDGDPEVTDGNFILKLGDSNYTGTEPFTMDEYEMAKTYTVGNGPKIVIANAVGVTQDPSITGDPTGETITGNSYGKMVMMYPADLGGEKIAPYAVIAPLSDYQDFSFATEDAQAHVIVYVVAKEGVEEAELPLGVEGEIGKLVPQGDLINKLAGKTVYKFDIGWGAGSGSLKETLDEEVINKLELINYLDNSIDGDAGFASNFVLLNGDGRDSAHPFVLSEFTFTATSAE